MRTVGTYWEHVNTPYPSGYPLHREQHPMTVPLHSHPPLKGKMPGEGSKECFPWVVFWLLRLGSGFGGKGRDDVEWLGSG